MVGRQNENYKTSFWSSIQRVAYVSRRLKGLLGLRGTEDLGHPRGDPEQSGNPVMGRSQVSPLDTSQETACGRVWSNSRTTIVKIRRSPGFLSSHVCIPFINWAKRFLNSFTFPAAPPLGTNEFLELITCSVK